jgi:hypothetical protein
MSEEEQTETLDISDKQSFEKFFTDTKSTPEIDTCLKDIRE